MEITEIFASIQGESTLQGLPCVFVRLTGCNLDCSYCDTRYARENGTSMTHDEILSKIASYSIPYVCLTGGEPLLQTDTPALAEKLIANGYAVSVETNGSLDASVLQLKSKRVIDIKCPGSGEYEKNFYGNVTDRRSTDEFKFVITDRNDFDFACSIANKYDLLPDTILLFSPAWKQIDSQLLAKWIINEQPGVRMHVQIHKYIWPTESRGR
ncbi:MAG: radical SAM protein [Candidatus Latescibacteria bacterium]|nr:radical SAM protein [Candidatus Latescibacterota bacterium]